MPCVANATRTPNTKLNGCYLADFTPLEPPMIPALLDYCVKEVENRGLSEVGLYRVPGNETEATELLEKFMTGRGPPPR
jgi:Rac GTPase-activating protein 1